MALESNLLLLASYTVQHKTLVGENFGGFGGSLPIRQSSSDAHDQNMTNAKKWAWQGRSRLKRLL